MLNRSACPIGVRACLPGVRGWIVVAIVAAVWIAAGVCHG